MNTLVLGLGNELLGDDGVGILAVRAIKNEVNGEADIIEHNLAGLSLIDILEGYDRAIIIDAISTGNYEVGSIITFSPDELRYFPCVSPHYTGLPDVIQIAKRLKIKFPDPIVILAVEIEKPLEVRAELSDVICESLKEVVNIAREQIFNWAHNESPGPN